MPAYETYHRQLTPEVRASLLAASPATLDRLLAQSQDIETRLPFALLGLDSDNGGAFLNWPLYPGCEQRAH